MATNRMFPQQEFKDALFADIDKYINDRKDKWYKQTGVERARKLKQYIQNVMLEQEQLTTTQVMWRLYSYATMEMGGGRLGTSKDLRVIILDRICASLGVKKEDINKKLSERLDAAMAYAMAATSGRAVYYVDDYQIGVEVRAEKIRPELVRKSASPVENVSEDFKKLMLDTIQEYINSIQASGWFTRWLSSTGLERAENLKLYITKQLAGKEKLNDNQLFARILEMTLMSHGEGRLGTSGKLRYMLLKGMCSWAPLQLDQEAIKKEIAFRSEPIIIPSMGGGIPNCSYYPDPASESINYRKDILLKAKKELFSRQKQVHEENQTVLSN